MKNRFSANYQKKNEMGTEIPLYGGKHGKRAKINFQQNYRTIVSINIYSRTF